MTLELQHLACYLPYGLDFITQSGKVFKSQTKDDFEIRIFKGNSPNGNKQYHSLTLGKINRGEFKPILRPLSDLNRYGEDIINEHSINLLISEKYNLDYGILSHFKGELSIDLDGDPDLRYDANKSISFNVMLTIQEELLKGHYDIFNLIENNLAIDINTINQ